MSELFKTTKSDPTSAADKTLAGVEQYLASVAQAEQEVTARERQAYVDLVAHLAPARTGPAPPPGSHALAGPLPDGPPPDPAQVVEILRAAKKTPEDLRRDVKLLVTIRDRADLAVTAPACRAAMRKASDRLMRFRERKRKLLKKVEAQDRAFDNALAHAVYQAEKAGEAALTLRWDQHLTGEVQRLRSARSSPGSRAPDKERDKREAAAHAEEEKAIAAAEAKADQLGLLWRAFFPPPLEPEAPPKAAIAEWLYTPRPDQDRAPP